MKVILYILLLTFAACRSKVKDGYTDTPTSGLIPICVDESFEPILQQEIDVFESIYTQANVLPHYCNEIEAVSTLLKDSVRLAVTSRPLTREEQESFRLRKFFPREVKIAVDGIALIINNQNQDTLISLKELRKILTGEIGYWQQLYSQALPEKIEVVFDHSNSSTVRFALDSICQGKAFSKSLRAEHSNARVIDYVATHPAAIGIVGVSWLQNPEDSTRLSFLKQVKVMAVSREEQATPDNSYKPWQAYLALGQYPLRREIYVLLTDPRNGLASGLASFLASDRGQRIILKAGLIPQTQPVRVVNVREKL